MLFLEPRKREFHNPHSFDWLNGYGIGTGMRFRTRLVPAGTGRVGILPYPHSTSIVLVPLDIGFTVQ